MTDQQSHWCRHHRNDPSSAWGGMKDSGVGRENGREAYYAYSQSKSTIINYAPEDEVCKFILAQTIVLAGIRLLTRNLFLLLRFSSISFLTRFQCRAMDE